MKLREIYELAVEKGIKEDQRPKKQVQAKLKDARKRYREATGHDKKVFDKDAFFNPYYDTRILNGTGDEEIEAVMVGIDMEVPELLLADRLRRNGKKIDLVISHHPEGRALAQLDKVMDIQPDLWKQYGLTDKVADGLMKERIAQVSRGVSPANHNRAVDAARLLGIPYMCTHTVADNCVAGFLQKLFDEKKPRKVRTVVNMLKRLPEFKQSMKVDAGPYILIGDENDDAGRIFVDMTGGTSGPEKMFGRLNQAGIGTIVGMHCKESGYKTAKSEFMNYVIAGHIASDNLGMNLLYDHIEKKAGKLEFIECSGFKRHRRI
jgi:hypothetical protein